MEAWFITDIGQQHYYTRDGQLLPIKEATSEDINDSDGCLWRFETLPQAQAFCNGVRACALGSGSDGFVVPVAVETSPGAQFCETVEKILSLCKLHGISIGHEASGSFIVRPWNKHDQQRLRAAYWEDA